MTKQARISPDGDLRLPKDLVAQEGWQPGQDLEVVHTGHGILIRPTPAPRPERERISWEDFVRQLPPHEGPPKSLEEMNRAIDEAMAERWKAKEARSR